MPSEKIHVDHRLPAPIESLLLTLRGNGYEAYVIGGAVRDILIGKTPEDYDVATSAEPQEVMKVFGEKHCHPTGLSHGTVTVVVDGVPVEVTTFRVDGDYTDSRHPENVRFTRSLKQDVMRRDFTVNALALSEDGTVLDFCGGVSDLKERRLRTVGDPKERFQEDALRILRALRFASEHGFAIEEETSREIFRQKDSLKALSVERIWKEFSKLICGAYCAPILRRYFGVFTVFLPEIAPMQGFEQHNPHHIYDVWEHTLVAMTCVPPTVVLRMAILLHDIGKPSCFEIGEDGIGHFRGHPKVSAVMADTILSRLKVDTDTRETVVLLVKAHDVPLDPVLKNVRRRLAQYGEEKVRLLLEVKRADISAHSLKSAYRLKELSEFEVLLDRAIEEQMCFSFSAMAINGKDLIELGIDPGARLGSIKKQLLNEIIDGVIPNDREALLARAQVLFKNCQ
ncbi:MAG: HD domain-containing protein [Clostridiales bacterium]|nr:HD domain-containing protein [Clostridiales bacterium]